MIEDAYIERLRKHRQKTLNAEKATRNRLENRWGKVWDTEELRQEFEVLGFLAPFAIIKHKVTGKKGTVEFQHLPRFYFNYQEDSPPRL